LNNLKIRGVCKNQFYKIPTLGEQIRLFRNQSLHIPLYETHSVRIKTSLYTNYFMQSDQTYERERKNLTEEEEEESVGSNDEIDAVAVKDTDEEDNEDDIGGASDTQGN
jgi:hypothetical protein